MKVSPVCVVRENGPPTFGLPTSLFSSSFSNAEILRQIIGPCEILSRRTLLLGELLLLVAEVHEEPGSRRYKQRCSHRSENLRPY